MLPLEFLDPSRALGVGGFGGGGGRLEHGKLCLRRRRVRGLLRQLGLDPLDSLWVLVGK